MTEPTVEEIMTTKVISVHPESPAAEVVTRLHAYRISCLVVCEKRIPVGIVTERDIVGLLFRFLAGNADPSLEASDFMSHPVFTVKNSDSVADALDFAQQNRVRHLPVVDHEGELAGLLTQTDLLRALMI